jgi:mono/diheme cytochrome c family protein
MLRVDGPEQPTIYSGREVDEAYLGDQAPRPRPAPATDGAALQPGEATFVGVCSACHQRRAGAAGVFPPLASSRLPHGRQDPLDPRWCSRASAARSRSTERELQRRDAPLANLTDHEIADVLTYVRNHFGNQGDAVTDAEVAAVRASLVTRRLRGTRDSRRALVLSHAPALGARSRRRRRRGASARPSHGARPPRDPLVEYRPFYRAHGARAGSPVRALRARRTAGDQRALPRVRPRQPRVAAQPRPRLFADQDYLAHWQATLALGPAARRRSPSRACRGSPRARTARRRGGACRRSRVGVRGRARERDGARRALADPAFVARILTWYGGHNATLARRRRGDRTTGASTISTPSCGSGSRTSAPR